VSVSTVIPIFGCWALGHGGMGGSWPKILRFGRFVALKFLPVDAAQDSQSPSAFAARRPPPSTIRSIHEIVDYGGGLFIAKELPRA
jgi:hypothetical protein